ncbi:MAG: UbiD family decarboxylase [Desulfobacterales bacterium]|nr:UbiD family decarboxylase [Desulfobacterales bacterium]
MAKKKYKNLSQHLVNLEKKGLLIRVKREINKDTELHPLVRWQYRGGIAEKDRKAFLFENVVDAKGKKYDMPVVVGALAANPEIYFTGMGCKPEEVNTIWQKALANRIDPVVVDKAACQEVVIKGKDLDKEGNGTDRFPVPISTPGFDNAPYSTCSHWFTKDIETGIQNIGNYRGQMKQRRKVGCFPSGLGQDIQVHWEKANAKGVPLEAALVIGAPPVVSYAAVQKIPREVDEITVAGGLVGEPIPVVKCKTVDILVPADAEIVIEGIMSTEYLEPEGPFGESHGYMHPRQTNPFMEITCITHKKKATFVSWISQVTPSESSVVKKVGYEPLFINHLKNVYSIKCVKRVYLHEPLTNLRKFIVIQMDKPSESEVWRAMYAAVSLHQGVGKILVAVDTDIDPENLDAVMWAMCYRMKPHLDVQILKGLEKGHAPPFGGASVSTDIASQHDPADESAMLINAILKEPYPPISLPKKKYMENAKKIWEELGLPPLTPQPPWFGYSLGQWDEELEMEAERALKGDHFINGDNQAKMRVKV